MDTDQLVEQLARMTVQERNEFAEKLNTKWPHLAVQIKNLLELYEMINKIDQPKEYAYPGSDCQV